MGSDFLFARPSFWGGAARVLDLGNTLTEFNQSPTPDQADCIAMRADWGSIGQDFREAIGQLEQELAEAEDSDAKGAVAA
ncbi:MAG: hypothetical protein HY332_05455 [Chloroflexi bacterium]|nr:hypothetical protein [Chloroflexota bacterium]